MKLGVFTVLYRDLAFEDALDRLAGMGVEAVEIGTGNYPGDAHCKPDELLADPEAAKAFKDAVERRGMVISGLSQHGNPVHPDASFRERDRKVWESTIRLAEVLEVPVVMAFSGCPGDHEGARFPNWVTCPWPDDYLKILDWQWNEVVIPYWAEAATFARSHGVERIGFEMHPGFVVYNPETLLRLRSAVGPSIGANLDPSHLFWQGIDVVEAIKTLGREHAIYHVHAKDTFIDEGNVRRNGVLDTKHYGEIVDRAWTFRTVGYGMGEKTWRDIVSALRAVDYDYVLSIEHEDLLLSAEEGLRRGVDLLSAIIPREPKTDIWWA
ncbi:MAG TPA: sugar phosphate isomerase/epimerase [Actinomycetota bacterium]|nr:sugar phosphate isomerase/epimerase [Actinomycetota bacterium]